MQMMAFLLKKKIEGEMYCRCEICNKPLEEYEVIEIQETIFDRWFPVCKDCFDRGVANGDFIQCSSCGFWMRDSEIGIDICGNCDKYIYGGKYHQQFPL